jgi:hypothetical protein
MRISSYSFFRTTFNVIGLIRNELNCLNNRFFKSAISFLIVANFICIMMPILFLIIFLSLNPNSSIEILFPTDVKKSLEKLITSSYFWLICNQFVLLIVKKYLKKLDQL